MRQDYFEFDPCCKVLIGANNKPILRSVDEAWRRRLNLIPFNVTIPPTERDLYLVEKLRAEWPGILQWAIDGCLAWQDVGLAPPDAVSGATKDYLDAEDTLKQWIAERCKTGRNKTAGSTALYADWKAYATDANEPVGTLKAFVQDLEKHGYRKARREGGTGKKMIAGLALRDDDQDTLL